LGIRQNGKLCTMFYNYNANNDVFCRWFLLFHACQWKMSIVLLMNMKGELINL
jgi:hypothetical protein